MTVLLQRSRHELGVFDGIFDDEDSSCAHRVSLARGRWRGPGRQVEVSLGACRGRSSRLRSADVSSDFFEAMYAQADGDDEAVPWQHAMSRRIIADWLGNLEPGRGERAVVVAAGLGDDAAALAATDRDVVAFDAAPSAVEWARARHPGADVDWTVADLFDLPDDWSEAFDLVVEVFTVQSIEPARQPDAAIAIRELVAPGGTLVAVALVHDGSIDPSGPPWPLHPATVEVLGDGLEEAGRRVESVDDHVTCVLVELARADR